MFLGEEGGVGRGLCLADGHEKPIWTNLKSQDDELQELLETEVETSN